MVMNEQPTRAREAVNPASIHLTPLEKEWLVKLSTSHEHRLSRLADEPPMRAMSGLVKKGLAKNIMDTHWTITDLGQQRCTTIY